MSSWLAFGFLTCSGGCSISLSCSFISIALWLHWFHGLFCLYCLLNLTCFGKSCPQSVMQKCGQVFSMWLHLLHISACLLGYFLPLRWVCSGLGSLAGVLSHLQPVNLFEPLLISLQDCVCCWSSSAHAGKCPSRALLPCVERKVLNADQVWWSPITLCRTL